MKRIISTIVLSLFLISTIGGCASTSNTQNKTLLGAGLGAIAGAVIGVAKTGNLKGALAGAAIGGAAGGLAGFIVGKYEEKQLRTKREVYSEYPEYSKRPYTLKPDIKKLTPQLFDSNDRPIGTFIPGQTIKMVSEYTVLATPDVDNVNIEENNYIVGPDGTKTPDAIREKSREVQRIRGYQTITLPDELLPGNYTHVATVKIGNKVEKKEQVIEVASLHHGTKQYAFTDVSEWGDRYCASK